MALFTVGHGTQSRCSLSTLLRDAGIEAVVDVRRFPGSRRHPQFAREALARWLPEAGLAYRWEPVFGGFRTLPPDSPDIALRNRSFRAYAAHMRTAEFSHGMDTLVDESRQRRIAVMCSESLWWRCHRRLISDHARLVERLEVRHLMPDGGLADHILTSVVRVDGNQLVYDGSTLPLS